MKLQCVEGRMLKVFGSRPKTIICTCENGKSCTKEMPHYLLLVLSSVLIFPKCSLHKFSVETLNLQHINSENNFLSKVGHIKS